MRFVTRCWFISRCRATTLKGDAPCNRAFDTKYKYGQRVHKEIDCSPCNHAYSVVFRMRRNARRYITRIAQSISSQYLRGFFIVVCSLCNSLLVCFPDDAPGYIRALFACCETPWRVIRINRQSLILILVYLPLIPPSIKTLLIGQKYIQKGRLTSIKLPWGAKAKVWKTSALRAKNALI